MTPSPQTDREQAEDEAAAWLVLLSEAPDDAELRARFEAWLGASVLNADIWARTSRAYDLVGQGTPHHRAHWASYAAEGRPGRALPSISPSRWTPGRRHPFARRRLGIAAAAAMAAVLAVFLLPGLMLRMQADAVTAAGEVRVVTLADGSRVALAPESAIDSTFAGRERRVRLLKGEAFFEVTHDPSRPFSVVAGDAVATVLGTGFDVRRDDEGTVVAVEHGHVRVDDNIARPVVSADLHAGDWVRVTGLGQAVRGSVQPGDVADWRRGELIARDRPAGEIVDKLRRYYAGAILVRDDAFAAKRVSGIYDLRHPEQTLRELAASHGAAVRGISPWLLVVTAE